MNISSIQAAERPLQAVQQPAAVEAATQAAPYTYKPYYYSPALAIDPTTGAAIVEIRNSTTGAVTAQYPTEKDLKAYSEKSLKPETAASTDQPVAGKTVEARPAEAVKPATPPPEQPDTAAAATPAKPQASILA